MFTHERHQQLNDYLAERGYASLGELVSQFGVSVSTVRRDLEAMQRLGTVRRTHGGAVYLGTREHPIDYGQRETQNRVEKEAIGAIAASFVRDGDTVLLDGGTTTFQVARHLTGRALQVVTNSVPIASLLGTSSNPDVYLLGGYVMPQTGVSVGTHAEKMLSSLHLRLAIMGAAGITEDGLFNAHLLMVEIERLMMQCAEEVMIVADHTKFGRRSLARICELGRVTHVISDAGLEECWETQLRDAGINVQRVEI